jgi:AcrR family transcriptional regulator
MSSQSSFVSSLSLVRAEPVQARSSQRLVALLDATARVVHEVGYEMLTTAMVAETAQASIGTVYRYFPDRIAVLQALITRNRARAEEEVFASLRASSASTVADALDIVFYSYADLFREEPGFRSLRLGDMLDIRPVSSTRTGNVDFAHALGDELAHKLGLTLDSAARMALESAVEVMDGLLGKAFLRVERGDKAVIAEARRLFHLSVDGVF